MQRTKQLCHLLIVLLTPLALHAESQVIRLGMIGLDTSHVIAFTKYINDPGNATGCRVVAGYPGGSPDVEASASRVDKYTLELRDKYNMEIVDSIESLCQKVDGILLESVDGRPHLKQAIPVITAGKPLFIDKPMAGNLTDVLEIFRLAKKHQVPCWSSSSLRYTPGILDANDNPKLGQLLGCAVHAPCSLEPHHPDLYWYGVHGVEMLFTAMGTGCQTVTRTQTDGFELVVGVWKDGRIGTFRGLRQGKSGYGATLFGTKSILPSGSYPGYAPLVDQVVKFFKTGKAPVSPKETIEIFAFMSAADASKAASGAAISIADTIAKARQQ
jgi:hypothetical protein